jgi:hypothetical protein
VKGGTILPCASVPKATDSAISAVCFNEETVLKLQQMVTAGKLPPQPTVSYD